MIPKADSGQRSLVQRLLTRVIADTQSTYTASDGLMIGLLLNALADELEQGVDRRMRDIMAMRNLLQSGQAFYPCDIEPVPQDLTLRAVNASHDALTRNLVALHTAVELDDSSDAQALNRDIWFYLTETVQRHQVNSVP